MENFILSRKEGLWLGSFPRLTQAGFINGCSTRLQGESSIKPGLFNLALHVGDNPVLVNKNRQHFAKALGVQSKSFTTCAQVHGSNIAVVNQELVGSGAAAFSTTIAETDSLITNLPNVPLLLFFADCVPVLLADTKTGAIGLAHAGWRGTVAAIAAKTAAAMEQHYGTNPRDIVAAIGPSIGSCCYEVDDYVLNQAQGYEEYFHPKGGGKYMLDLWGINRQQLLQSGVAQENIITSGICTMDSVDLFCSYRAEQGRTGRMGVCLCRPK